MEEHVPIIGIARHRLGVDSEGVTTLVVFHSCPLRCKYCLNPRTITESTEHIEYFTCKELYGKVKADELYFLATGGGVTFGGGEPALRYEFVRDFRKICGEKWRIYVETSLNVPQQNIEALISVVDGFIVDVKDMNPNIYEAYTKRDNTQVLANLRFLANQGRQDDVLVRLPLIPDFNTAYDRGESRAILEKMGFMRFDEFVYIKY